MFSSSSYWRALLSAFGLGLCTLPAHAATFTVSNLDDSGAGSLRQAVLDANGDSDADTIVFESGVTGTIALTSGELPISQSVTITGPGAGVLAVSGGNASRLFNISAGTVTMSGLTLTGGSVVGATGTTSGITGQPGGEARGGAILNAGVLSLSGMVLSQNSVTGGQGGPGRGGRGGAGPGGRGGLARGGAIYNAGTLSLADTRLENNSVMGGNGGAGGSIGTRQGAGGAGGAALGGAIFNANILDVGNATFANNSVIGGKGETGATTGANGSAENPDVRDVSPRAEDVSAQGTQNRALSVQLKGTGDGTLTYSLVSGELPDGLTLNPNTGVISGTLTRNSQSTTVTYKVSDGIRDSNIATVTFTIAPIEAQSLVVTTTADVVDDADNLTSLREAINYANTLPDASTIGFQLPDAAPNTFVLGDSALLVEGKITVAAAKRGDLTLVTGDGGAFAVGGDAVLNLRNLVVEGNGNSDYAGVVSTGQVNISNCSFTRAGIFNLDGTVNLSDSRLNGSRASIQNGLPFQNNLNSTFNIARCELSQITEVDSPIGNSGVFSISDSTYSGNGGWSVNNGSMNVSGCTFTGNSNLLVNLQGDMKISGCTFRDNEGSLGNASTMDVSGCTLSGNSSVANGLLSNIGTLRVANCTLYGNTSTSSDGGGVIQNGGSVEVDSCTLTGNSVTPENAGLLYNDASISSDASIKVRNTLIVGNSGTVFGSDATKFEVANSLIGGTAKAAGLQTDSAGVPVLKNNGGATETVALVASSPAVGAGQTTLNTDQRGFTRPTGTGADIGAFELQSISAPPVISVSSPSVREGDSGTKAMAFNLTLSKASKNTVSVVVNTSQGTAKAGSDYVSVPRATVTFAPGTTKQSFAVQIKGDTTIEDDEQFRLDLRSPVNATLGTANGTGTIVNDDLPTISIDSPSVREGNNGTTALTFTLTLSQPRAEAVSVLVNTIQGTATAGSDYQAVGRGTVTFAPGTTKQTFTVQVIGDTLVEGNEQFRLALRSPLGATLAKGFGIGTIVNDDSAPRSPSFAPSANAS